MTHREECRGSTAPTPPIIRVLHVITRLELGGAQRNTLYTVAHLDPARFEAHLAWGPGDRLDVETAALPPDRLHPVSALIRPVRPGRDLAAVADLRRVMRRLAPHVVHTHSSKAGILGRAAARLERVPVIVHTIHGFGFTPLQPLPVRAAFRAAERLLARVTTHFVAVSRPNLELGLEMGLFPPERVSLIRSGIALDRRPAPDAVETWRHRLGLETNHRLVIQIGNLKPQKAPLDFVRVAARVAAVRPEARFVLAGDGPLRGQAERLARELGLDGRLWMPGWVDDVAGLLAASSVSVLTSRHEGLPRSIVESLAAGVPVVATAVDGTAEIVQPGINGLLAAPGDVPALADAIVRLLGDDALRSRLAAAARRDLEAFDIDMMVRQQEDLYTCLLSRSL